LLAAQAHFIFSQPILAGETLLESLI
jgi:hypothetical protein